MSCWEIKEQTQRRNVEPLRHGELRLTASGRYLARERHRSIFTRTSSAFDANALSHDISTPGFLRCPHEWTVGMRRTVCANSHIALVRVDPVEESLRSHPFHGQTTLQQENRIGQQNHSVQSRQQSMDPNTQTVLTYHNDASHSHLVGIKGYVYNLHSRHKYSSISLITATKSRIFFSFIVNIWQQFENNITQQARISWT